MDRRPETVCVVSCRIRGERKERSWTWRTAVDRHGVEVFSRWWVIDDPRGIVLIAHGTC